MIQSHLRFLDIDDLIILAAMTSSSYNLNKVANDLGLTPPAVSHRLKKYRTYIPNFTLNKTNKPGQYYQLTPEAKEFCLKAKQALTTLLTYDDRVA